MLKISLPAPSFNTHQHLLKRTPPLDTLPHHKQRWACSPTLHRVTKEVLAPADNWGKRQPTSHVSFKTWWKGQDIITEDTKQAARSPLSLEIEPRGRATCTEVQSCLSRTCVEGNALFEATQYVDQVWTSKTTQWPPLYNYMKSWK